MTLRCQPDSKWYYLPDAANELFMTEGIERFIRSERGIVVKALVRGKSTVSLKIMNVDDKPIRIHEGTLVAQPVIEVKQSFAQADNCTGVLDHLRDLYVRTVQGMSKGCTSANQAQPSVFADRC